MEIPKNPFPINRCFGKEFRRFLGEPPLKCLSFIRKELQKNLSSQTRFEDDRQRTINDYFRMGLDKGVGKGMMDACHAYLENTPGSKKAIKEILSKKKIKNNLKINPKQTSEPIREQTLEKSQNTPELSIREPIKAKSENKEPEKSIFH